jgi:hypothetical protein
MSTDLGTRLQELAGDTVMTPGRPEELWQRGRSWQRRRLSGVALIVAVTVLLLGSLSGLAWQRAELPTGPASNNGGPMLPDRIFEPSPWLPGTAEAGPLGQVVALMETDRGGWTGTTRGVLGISAATGEYRFLDLPGAALETVEPPALSPDGTRVAYWLTGKTSGTPNTRGGGPVVGVGVYDTRTEEVSKELLPTEHGLWAEDLMWADNETLVFGHGQRWGGDDASERDQSSGTSEPLRIWRPGAGTSRVLDMPRGLTGWHSDVLGTSAGGSVLLRGRGEKNRWVVDVDRPEAAVHLLLQTSTADQLLLDPTGTRLAGLYSGPNGSNPNRVVTGRLPTATGKVRDVTLTFVPSSGRTVRVIGWTDSAHVSVVRRLVGERFSTASALLDVHVRTGAATQRVRLPDEAWGSNLHFATDLLGAPTAEATEPQRPLDPRVVAGWGGGTVLLALLLGVGWIRRARP